MIKGTHLERGPKTTKGDGDIPSAYMNVATELNKSLHKGSYEMDIDKTEVARMIDLLVETNEFFTSNVFMERDKPMRITRSLKRALDRGFRSRRKVQAPSEQEVAIQAIVASETRDNAARRGDRGSLGMSGVHA